MKDSIIAKILLSLIIIGFLGLGFSGYSNISQEPKLLEVGERSFYAKEFVEMQQVANLCGVVSSYFQSMFSSRHESRATLDQVLALILIRDIAKKQNVIISEQEREKYQKQAIHKIISNKKAPNMQSVSAILNYDKRVLMDAIGQCQVFDLMFHYASQEQNIIGNENLRYYQLIKKYYSKSYDIHYAPLDGREKFKRYLTEPVSEAQLREFHGRHAEELKKLKLNKIKFIALTPEVLGLSPETIELLREGSTDPSSQTGSREEHTGSGQEQSATQSRSPNQDTTRDETQEELKNKAQDAWINGIQNIQIMLDQNRSLEDISAFLRTDVKEDTILRHSDALVAMNILSRDQGSQIKNKYPRSMIVELPRQSLPVQILQQIVQSQSSHGKGYGGEYGSREHAPAIVATHDQAQYWVVQYLPQEYSVESHGDGIVEQLYRMEQMAEAFRQYAQGLLSKLSQQSADWDSIAPVSHSATLNRAEITREIIIRGNARRTNTNGSNGESMGKYLTSDQMLRIMGDIDGDFTSVDRLLDDMNRSQKRELEESDSSEPGSENVTSTDGPAPDGSGSGVSKHSNSRGKPSSTETSSDTASVTASKIKNIIAGSPHRFKTVDVADHNIFQKIFMKLDNIRSEHDTDEERIGDLIIVFGIVHSFGYEFMHGLLINNWSRITLHTENIVNFTNIDQSEIDRLTKEMQAQ